MIAYKHKNIDLCKQLINTYGTHNINESNHKKESLLIEAVKDGNSSFFKYLINKKGIDLNIQDKVNNDNLFIIIINSLIKVL